MFDDLNLHLEMLATAESDRHGEVFWCLSTSGLLTPILGYICDNFGDMD